MFLYKRPARSAHSNPSPLAPRPSPLVIALVLFAAAAQAAPTRPNIVLVIGDDHGWPYYGFMESPQRFATRDGAVAAHDVAPTPNLDALAASGVVFTRGYATAPLCVPSLRSLTSASGLHSIQWEDRGERVKEVRSLGGKGNASPSRFFRTLPRELQRHGYLTWKGGKMWEGYLANAGFTHGIEGNLGEAQLFGRDKWSTQTCGSTGDPEVPCPALEPLREFLRQAAGQPFFAWVAPMLPHVPYNAPAEYRAPFEARGMNSAQVAHLSNIRWFDEVFGEVMRELDRAGVRENTLVVYLSDNGWGIDFQAFTRLGRGKGTNYDLGVRTPIIFAGLPDLVPARYDDLVISSDIVATILSLVPGGRIPTDSVGTDLGPRLRGGPPIDRDTVFTHHKGGSVLQLPWRYILHEDGREALYRIAEDPFELEDLAAEHPDLVREFRRRAEDDRERLLNPREDADVLGRVLDVNGSPIAGAQLVYGIGADKQIVSTDAQGYFILDPARSSSATLRPGLRLSSLYWNGHPRVPELSRRHGVILEVIGLSDRPPLQVPVGGRIVVRLKDARSGAPIAHASVRARARKPLVSLRSFTGADGIAYFEGLPAATYRVTAKGLRHHAVEHGDIAITSSEDVMTIDAAARPRRARRTERQAPQPSTPAP